jgi:hypothetical protein
MKDEHSELRLSLSQHLDAIEGTLGSIAQAPR